MNQKFLDLIAKMKRDIVAAQDHRKTKTNFVPDTNPGATGEEIEWVVYERQVMLDAVNANRGSLPPVEVKDIVRLETIAGGHCDYTSKLSIYCAELAMDITPRP